MLIFSQKRFFGALPLNTYVWGIFHLYETLKWGSFPPISLPPLCLEKYIVHGGIHIKNITHTKHPIILLNVTINVAMVRIISTTLAWMCSGYFILILLFPVLIPLLQSLLELFVLQTTEVPFILA